MKQFLKKLWAFRNRSFSIAVEDASVSTKKHPVANAVIVAACALFGSAITHHFTTTKKG